MTNNATNKTRGHNTKAPEQQPAGGFSFSTVKTANQT